jgi:hypothetical protein
MHLPIALHHTRELTSDLARSAHPRAPARAAPVVRRRSPGALRLAVASALRQSADRVAPVIE